MSPSFSQMTYINNSFSKGGPIYYFHENNDVSCLLEATKSTNYILGEWKLNVHCFSAPFKLEWMWRCNYGIP